MVIFRNMPIKTARDSRLPFIAGLLGTLSACSGASAVSEQDFLSCWQPVSVAADRFQINVRAVLYPRERVLAANSACPGRRLHLLIQPGAVPEGFTAFETEERSAMVGISGTAIVSIDRRETDSLLAVQVHTLRDPAVLSAAETQVVDNQVRVD